MENQLQIFDNPEFGKVRVVQIDGEPWFVGKDVATALGYANPQKALRDHVPDKFKRGERIVHPQGGAQDTVVINEAGVYKLAMRSKLPNAEKFSDWACGEVLPSIRKHGAYLTVQAAEQILLNPDFIIKLAGQVKQAQLERDQFKALAEAHEETIRELKPKAEFCDRVLESDELFNTTFIAKEFGMTAADFNKLLEKMDIEFKRGKRWTLHQKYAGYGYMKAVTATLVNGYNATNNYWTHKGRMFLHNTLRAVGILPVCEREEIGGGLFPITAELSGTL